MFGEALITKARLGRVCVERGSTLACADFERAEECLKDLFQARPTGNRLATFPFRLSITNSSFLRRIATVPMAQNIDMRATPIAIPGAHVD